MARMTKAQREELERRQRMAAMEQWLNTPGRHIEGWEDTYAPDDRFAGVEGGVTSTASPFEPTAPVEVEEEELSPEQLIVREQLMRELGLTGANPDPALVDSALGLTGMLANVAGVGLDALSPDPHVLDPSTFGPAGGHSGLASTAQHLADVALEIPGAARGILEWAGLENASRSLGIHGLLEAAEGRAGETIEERERRALAVAEARQEAGLPTIEELRNASPFNQAADALYGFGENLRGYTSPELKAAQEGLGQSMEDGLGSTLGYLASGPGVRALATGVIPESAAYAVPQLAVSRTASLLGTGPRLAKGAANTMTAYTVAQQNARDVTDGIMSLSPEEALQLPDVAAEFERVGNIDVAKSIVANRARLTALAGGVLTSPLYGIDSFSRMGAGVAQRATATMPVRALTVGGRESLGEFGQEGMEAVVGDLGRLRAGQISRDEVGATALPQAALGAIAGFPTAAGASVGQSISEFDARARRLEEAAERLEALYADRQANQDAVDVAQANQSTAPDPARADPEDNVSLDTDPLPPSELRTTEQVAADEAARLALSGIPAMGRPARTPITTRPLNRDDQEIINRRLLALEPENEAEQEAWRTFMSVPAGRDLENSPLRGEGGRFTGERFGDNLNQLARDERGRLQGGTVRDRMRPRQPSEEELTADAQRLADSLVAEQQVEAEADDAQITRDRQLQEAREFDQREQERGDAEANKRLATAKGQHTRNRRAHLGKVREANMHLDPEARAEAIADAGAVWDAANPRPTLETLPPEAPRARRPRAPQRPVRTPRPGARAAPAAPEAAVEPVAEEAPTTVPQDRREALRARYGRAQDAASEEAPAGRSAAEVVRELAGRVRRGTDKSALEAEALLTGGKLSIVDPEVMAAVAGATESTEGYYDGERMYINAASLPAGDPIGVLFNSVLAHEANHAATSSQNPDAVSKARVLLEDAPRRKLIEQLETANHPTAIAAREAVAARNIDKEADPSRYEDEMVAYAINHAIESGGRSWAPIRGIVSAARRKMKEYTGSDNLNLDDLGHYARATVNALAESEAGINAPGVAGREQASPATSDPVLNSPYLAKLKSLDEEWSYLEDGTDIVEAINNRDTASIQALAREAWNAYDNGNVDFTPNELNALEELADWTDSGAEPSPSFSDRIMFRGNPEGASGTVVSSDGALGPGVYLTSSRQGAESYGPSVEEFRMDVQNPLVITMADVEAADGNTALAIANNEAFAEENFHSKGAARRWARGQWNDWAGIQDPDFQSMVRDAGYDSVVLMDGDEVVEANVFSQANAIPAASVSPEVAAMQAEAEQMAQDSGLATAQAMVEGTATQVAENVRLPIELLQTIPGTIAESRGPGDGQYDQLLAVVESDGYRSDRPVDVRVNHRGEAYIVDGNTRVAVAAERGLESIPANIQWMNGAENTDNPLSVYASAFEGRAQEPVSKAQEAAANQNRGPYLRTKGDEFAAGVKDLVTIHGSIGEGTGVLMQEANYARDAVYQTAVHRYHRVGPAMDSAADKAMANEEGTLRDKRARFNDMILERIDNIAKLPSEDAKDKALARLVQQYPDLAPLQEAIHDINKMTEEIISARFAYADSRPLTEEEWTLYDYMHNNKYGYMTNVYAAFQGKDGKKYAEAIMSAGREGLAALSRGEEVPANIKRLYQVYDDALSFVMNNDVAVSDPEMLAAMDVQDVRELYNRWMPDDISADALATEFREANNGTLDTDSFKAYMEDAIAEHVSILQDPEFVAEDGTTGSQILYNEANAVLNGLLGLTPLPNTALRYAKVRGIDTTVLEHRKPLPGPIAELYGQIRDIPSLINATLTRQGELASRLKFFNKLATEAYGDAVVSAADRHKAGNEDFTVPLNGPSFGRLNGMYTTHEMAQRLTDYGSMFTDLVDTIAVVGIDPTIGRRWMEHRAGKIWTTGAGLQKAMKIVTRPDYTLLNLVGSFSAPVLAGGVKPAHLLTGMKVALEHIALQVDPKGRAVGPELSAAHQLALQTGAFDNAVTQELRRAPRKLVNRLLEEMTTVDTVGEAMSLLKRAYNWSNDRGWQTLVESYSLADTWVKLPVLLERMDYLESYYRANGDSVSNDRIQEEAARYMRDATISMDNVPGFAKLLERGGVSFYLPYFASVFRTLHKSNVHIVDSLEMAVNAKTPEARWIAHKDAGRKLAGVSTVWATAAAGLRLVAELGMSDDDREQMERDRELMFDEGKYGDLTYVGTNDQDHRQYFVASRTDQFGPAFDAIRRFQRTGSVEEALKSIPEELIGLLVMNRFFGATIDHVARGGKDTQLERTFPKATEFLLTQANKVPGGYAAMDYALTVGDLISPAGIMNYFDPRNKTPDEVDGDAAAILAVLAQGTGHKLLTVNPEAALGGKGWAVSNHRRDANSRIRDSIQNLGPRQGFETFQREASRERALMEDLGKAYHAMIDSGMSRQQVEEMISSVDATTIRNLRNRAYTSESARWIKEFSGLLSKNSINNPPEFRDLPAEERAEAQEEWKRQAYEMNRMLNALGLEENK